KGGSKLLGAILNGQGAWRESFDEETINAWLAVDFEENHGKILPARVTNPRVAIEGDRLRMGFQWSAGPFSTVVQVTIGVWVPKPNWLAVELHGAKAGLAPMPTTQLRRLLERAAEKAGCEVTWKRNDTTLVGLVRLPNSSGVILRQADIRDGKLSLAGRSTRISRLATPGKIDLR
ncbi:MAG TPA: hypothetical protein VNC50_20785, partial [Planctomycetia bacterium]|nr:hypothetical protein [Planctomycetia bacterium]